MGLAVLKQAFPAARFVALPDTVRQIEASWKAKLEQWGPMYGANLPAAAVIPEPLEGTTLTLEGQTLEVKVAQGDTKDNSIVWIPSLRTAICGDIVYAGVHPWTLETTAADRKAWIAALDEIAALSPARVVAGHKDPRLGDDPSSLAFMKAYLRHYDAALASATSSQALQAKVKARYPKLLLDVILKIAADGAFPAKAG
jgi:glyoxylase-like metal-dependent hydrolase (beta-lactamase superfamily II)